MRAVGDLRRHLGRAHLALLDRVDADVDFVETRACQALEDPPACRLHAQRVDLFPFAEAQQEDARNAGAAGREACRLCVLNPLKRLAFIARVSAPLVFRSRSLAVRNSRRSRKTPTTTAPVAGKTGSVNVIFMAIPRYCWAAALEKPLLDILGA